MARFYGAWGNNDNRYRLVVDLNIISQDINNNNTSLQWIYYVESDLSVRYFNAQFDRELTINGVKVHDVLGSYNMGSGGLREVARGTTTISHNSDGTKTVAFSGFGKTTAQGYSWSFDRTISDSYTLTTIPRASDPSVNYSSRALGDVLRITTNRASTGFTHTLAYKVGSSAYTTIGTNVGAYLDWTLPNSIASLITSSTSGTVTIRCYTYSGSTHIGTEYVTFTATIPNNSTFKPTASITSLNVVDGLGGYYVQGKSKVNVVSNGSGKYGASISQYRITIDGSNYYGSNITSGVINKNGAITVTLRVTDSRGYYSETTSTVTFQEYYSPKLNSFSARRDPAGIGTGLYVALNYEIAPIANQNSKEYVVYYRAVGASSWIELARSTSNYSLNTTHSASGVLDFTISYEVKIVVSDDYSSPERTVSSQTTSIYRVLNILADKSGLAIGKFAERPGIFDIALPTDFSQTPTVNGVEIGGGVNSERIPSGADLNNYTSEGLYYNPSNAETATMSNTPTAQAFSLLVERHAGYKQTFTVYSTSSIATWVRNYYNGTWGSWRQVWQADGSPMPHTHSTLNDVSWNRSQTDSGYIDFGPANARFAHIYTDRPTFYFNKSLLVNGTSVSMDGHTHNYDKAITASGSNSNGYYVLFADGTQICWRYHSRSIAITTSWGGGYSTGDMTYTFPRAFTNYPSVNLSIVNAAAGNTVWTGLTAVTTTGMGGVALRFTSSSFTGRLMYVAIGRG